MKTLSEYRKIDGAWVKALRKALGFNQHELAECLGVSRSAVARWELGAFNPSRLALKVLMEFADANRGSRSGLSKGRGTSSVKRPVRYTQRSHKRRSHVPAQRIAGTRKAKRKRH
ncbi:MAG TPA: helix-turn-helix transcriptional regulator [bacterium]|jgi:transcriptional regulator with XRE-family HTH domain|nr:helix-turn-helix transcriptional regulator [bacterium]